MYTHGRHIPLHHLAYHFPHELLRAQQIYEHASLALHIYLSSPGVTTSKSRSGSTIEKHIPLIRMSMPKLRFMLTELNETCTDCSTKKDWADRVTKAKVASALRHLSNPKTKRDGTTKTGRFQRARDHVTMWAKRVWQYFFNSSNTDADGDGIPDAAEADADNDGIPDELADGFNSALDEINADHDGEHRPQFSRSFGSADRDGDGIADSDRDGDGVPDNVEDGLDALRDMANNVGEEEPQGSTLQRSACWTVNT